MASEVKWIKISTGVFDDEAFQMIEDLPEADAIELIWFKLLVLAGKQNTHGLFLFKDTIAYTDEMLASIFHRPINIVRLAMETFTRFKMVEVIDGVYSIPKWDNYQSLDGLEKKKERDREYQRKCREKKKALLEEKEESSKNRLTSDDSSYSYSLSLSNSFSLEIKEIIDYLNLKAGTRYTYENKSFNKYITARLKENWKVEDFKTVIDKKTDEWINTPMEQYLKPTTLFAPSHFEEYLNQNIVKDKPKSSNKFNNFQQRDYSKKEMEEMEEWLLSQ